MMDYRRASLAGTVNKAGINSHMYATFAGATPARNTNGILAETVMMWWDEERIEATVTRPFVASKLRPDEQLRLDEPLGFGDGLTDDTYMEWIELKAKRIFLILVDLGVPDQIFGVIDDSWDDDDLPVPMDQVGRLQLTYDKDEKLERKFFHRQFIYLLRNIQKGDQLYYDDEEVVPLELSEKRPVGAVTGLIHSNVDKVHLPGRPDDIFLRRRIPLGVTTGRMPQEEFLSGVEAMKAIEHDHLISLWASYIHEDSGYLLLTPVNDSSLKSFLSTTPQSIKILAKLDRRILLLNWLHCLADALSFLHSRGLAHRNIKPSNVMLDVDNHIFLGDLGIFHTTPLIGDKRGFDKETYDYSAPEQAQRPPTSPTFLVPMTSYAPRPSTSATARRSNSLSTCSTTSNSTSSDERSSFLNSIGAHSQSSNSSTSHQNSRSFNGGLGRHDPQKSDIFSLGTIFLEILNFLLKRASKNFASHRSAKNKTQGRGGGLPDSSFHQNLSQVEGWMNILSKDASKKEDRIFRGVQHILALVEKMISVHPEDRPNAQYVQERMYSILTGLCGLGPQGVGNDGVNKESRGRIHCETRRTDEGEFNFGFDQLRLASQRAAAEACASVNPTGAEPRVLGLNGGVIYGMERNPLASIASHRSSTVDTGPLMSGGSGSGGVGMRRIRSQEGDGMSIATKTSRSTGSEGKSKFGSGIMGGSGSAGQGKKPKAKAKAWQAPVYAELSFG